MESTEHPVAVTGVRRAETPEEASERIRKYKADHYQKNKERYRENNKRWHQENPDRAKEIYRESSRRRRAKHRDVLLERRRAQYKENPGPHRERVRKYAKSNPDKIRERDKKRAESGYFSDWKKKNKDKVNSYTRNRRSLISRQSDRYNHKDVAKLLEASDGLCYWCKKSLDGKYEVDHVWPIAKGGGNHVGNLCLSCPSCNRRKVDKTPQEFAGILL